MRKILLILLLPSFLYCQQWVDMMLDPSINFYETQQEFESYWQNKTVEKGKGWKQFKRWENFISPRVYPDGIIRPEMLYQEYNKLKEVNNQFKMLPPNVWTQVGPDNVPLESSGRKRGKATICLSDEKDYPCKFIIGFINPGFDSATALSEIYSFTPPQSSQLNETVERLFLKPSSLIQ